MTTTTTIKVERDNNGAWLDRKEFESTLDEFGIEAFEIIADDWHPDIFILQWSSKWTTDRLAQFAEHVSETIGATVTTDEEWDNHDSDEAGEEKLVYVGGKVSQRFEMQLVEVSSEPVVKAPAFKPDYEPDKYRDLWIENMPHASGRMYFAIPGEQPIHVSDELARHILETLSSEDYR